MRMGFLAVCALALSGCAYTGTNIPGTAALPPDGTLTGKLYYEKTQKHPKYGSQEKYIADGSCSLSFKIKNYQVSDRVRCGSFLINVVGSFKPDGTIAALKLKTLGTIYDMQGNINAATGLEPRNGFWKATLNLTPA